MRIGDDRFRRLPRFAARLYDRIVQIRPVQLQFTQVARDLCSRLSEGLLLDVGTGPGRLLREIHRINRDIELFGLDISSSMILIAERNLSGIPVDLRQENISRTSYPSNYFDLVTCTGSLYLWDEPEEGIEEIYRILKPDRAAYLYEPYRDVDAEKFSDAFRANLQQVNLLLRAIGPSLMRRVIKTARRVDEYGELIRRTSFANSHRIDRVVLGNLPMWLRIELRKVSDLSDSSLPRQMGEDALEATRPRSQHCRIYVSVTARAGVRLAPGIWTPLHPVRYRSDRLRRVRRPMNDLMQRSVPLDRYP